MIRTDPEIEALLRIQDRAFKKMYEARKEIRERLLRATKGKALLAVAQKNIHQTMVLFIDQYRREHPETEKK